MSTSIVFLGLLGVPTANSASFRVVALASRLGAFASLKFSNNQGNSWGTSAAKSFRKHFTSFALAASGQASALQASHQRAPHGLDEGTLGYMLIKTLHYDL